MKEKNKVIFAGKRAGKLSFSRQEEIEVQHILDVELDKEAERIEAYANKNPLSIAPDEQNRMQLEILKRVRREREDTEKTKNCDKKKSRSVWKLVTAAVCVIVMTFGMAMTSEANRIYLKNFWDMAFNGAKREKVDNDKDRFLQPDLEDELEARKKIQDSLMIQLPEFFYLPEGAYFYDYSIDTIFNTASLQYIYGEEIIWLNVCESQMNSSEGRALDGTYIETIRKDTRDAIVDVEIYGSQNEDGSECYNAVWVYKNASYDFGGKMNKEIFYNILKKMII